MNAIRATQKLNKLELENAVPPSASWHVDYRDTAYVNIGGLPLDLSEGDIITIFSQYGNPTHLNLVRDKETGKSRGFAFLKYEDQRSCDLAVDNLGGAEVLGRLLRVDHTRYKKRDDEDEDTYRIDRLEGEADGIGEKRASDTDDDGEERRRRKKKRKLLKEEKELEEMLAIKQDGEDEDPMKEYLIQEKKEEVARARQKEDDRERRHKHKRRDRDRSRDRERTKDRDRDGHRRRREEDDDEDEDEKRERHRKSREHRRRDESEGEDESRHSRRKRDISTPDDKARKSHRRRDDSDDADDRSGKRRDRSRDRDRDRHSKHDRDRESGRSKR